MAIPAEKILREAICAQVSSSLLAFIKMKELPQIIHNKINIPQLTTRSFFINNGQRSAISVRTNHFFLYCVSIKLETWEKFH